MNAKNEIAVKRQYAEGLKSLAKIDPGEIDIDYLKQDYEFYTALANSKLALGGTGTIKDAGNAMLDFVKNNPDSYHFLEAAEVLGDLLVAVRSYPLAEEYYGKLAKAPWPETNMKAGVLIGRAQLAQNKFAEALKIVSIGHRQQWRRSLGRNAARIRRGGKGVRVDRAEKSRRGGQNPQPTRRKEQSRGFRVDVAHLQCFGERLPPIGRSQ